MQHELCTFQNLFHFNQKMQIFSPDLLTKFNTVETSASINNREQRLNNYDWMLKHPKYWSHLSSRTFLPCKSDLTTECKLAVDFELNQDYLTTFREAVKKNQSLEKSFLFDHVPKRNKENISTLVLCATANTVDQLNSISNSVNPIDPLVLKMRERGWYNRSAPRIIGLILFWFDRVKYITSCDKHTKAQIKTRLKSHLHHRLQDKTPWCGSILCGLLYKKRHNHPFVTLSQDPAELSWPAPSRSLHPPGGCDLEGASFIPNITVKDTHLGPISLLNHHKSECLQLTRSQWSFQHQHAYDNRATLILAAIYHQKRSNKHDVLCSTFNNLLTFTFKYGRIQRSIADPDNVVILGKPVFCLVEKDTPLAKLAITTSHYYLLGNIRDKKNKLLLNTGLIISNHSSSLLNMQKECPHCIRLNARTGYNKYKFDQKQDSPSEFFSSILLSPQPSAILSTDICGPYYIHCQGTSKCIIKAYVLIISQPAIFQAHFLPIYKASTDALLTALLSFSNREGKFSFLSSDYGANYKPLHNSYSEIAPNQQDNLGELPPHWRNLLHELEDKNSQDKFNSHGCQFRRFAKSRHSAHLVENIVRFLKSMLHKLDLLQHKSIHRAVSQSEFEYILSRCQKLYNNRPIFACKSNIYSANHLRALSIFHAPSSDRSGLQSNKLLQSDIKSEFNLLQSQITHLQQISKNMQAIFLQHSIKFLFPGRFSPNNKPDIKLIQPNQLCLDTRRFQETSNLAGCMCRVLLIGANRTFCIIVSIKSSFLSDPKFLIHKSNKITSLKENRNKKYIFSNRHNIVCRSTADLIPLCHRSEWTTDNPVMFDRHPQLFNFSGYNNIMFNKQPQSEIDLPEPPIKLFNKIKQLKETLWQTTNFDSLSEAPMTTPPPIPLSPVQPVDTPSDTIPSPVHPTPPAKKKEKEKGLQEKEKEEEEEKGKEEKEAEKKKEKGRIFTGTSSRGRRKYKSIKFT
jgi:hypothetical protein